LKGVEVEDPESAKHESGGLRRLKGLKRLNFPDEGWAVEGVEMISKNS
jgi:hypothetical protein